MSMRLSCRTVVAAVLLLSGFTGVGAPFFYHATATNAAGLQPIIDQFKVDIGRGGTNNGNSLTLLANGWREVTWDDALNPGTTFQRADIHPNPYLNITHGGPASPFAVSGSASNLAYFSDINESYRSTFRPFSEPGLFGWSFEGSGTVEFGVAFRMPGRPFPRHGVSAFGMVFSDADFEQSAYMRVSTIRDPTTRGYYEVSALPGDLSFVGVRFTDGELIDSIAIGQLNGLDRERFDTPFGPDLIAIDNIIFAEPQIPEPRIAVLIVLGAALILQSNAGGPAKRGQKAQRAAIS